MGIRVGKILNVKNAKSTKPFTFRIKVVMIDELS